jgi:hypothetical protein
MYGFNQYGPGMMGGFGFFAVIAALWSIPWKGWALWIAARKGSKNWFVALLLVNSLGILDILYIYVFSKGDAKPVGKK